MRRTDGLHPYWDYQPIPNSGNLLKHKIFPYKYIVPLETSQRYFEVRGIKFSGVIRGEMKTYISDNLQKDILNL